MRGHLGPPFIPQKTANAVCAHHGAQLPVLQTRARTRVSVARNNAGRGNLAREWLAPPIGQTR
eukprot:4033289-Lingulodinium_polyedra.AAC.1